MLREQRAEDALYKGFEITERLPSLVFFQGLF